MKPTKHREPDDEEAPAVEKIRLKPRKPWRDVKQKVATKNRRKKRKHKHQ